MATIAQCCSSYPTCGCTGGTASHVDEYYTELPTTTVAALTDITCAVQGYVSGVATGVSVQETWQQVADLFMNYHVLRFAGNPNGSVAGNLSQMCWDTVNFILYICNSSGTSSTAVWEKVIQLTAGTNVTITQNGNDIVISASGGGGGSFPFTTVTSSPFEMESNSGYYVTTGSALVLPPNSAFGSVIEVVGGGIGQWQIAQGAGQYIIVGNNGSTVGVTGTIGSINSRDSVRLICIEADLGWQAIGGPQGALQTN